MIGDLYPEIPLDMLLGIVALMLVFVIISNVTNFVRYGDLYPETPLGMLLGIVAFLLVLVIISNVTTFVGTVTCTPKPLWACYWGL